MVRVSLTAGMVKVGLVLRITSFPSVQHVFFYRAFTHENYTLAMRHAVVAGHGLIQTTWESEACAEIWYKLAVTIDASIRKTAVTPAVSSC